MKSRHLLLSLVGCLIASLASAQNYSCTTFAAPSHQTFNPNSPITGFNKAGQLLGNTTGSGGFLRAPNGSVTAIAYPGSPGTLAYGLNNSGEIVGAYVNGTSHSFTPFLRRADGTYANVPTPAPYNNQHLLLLRGLNDSDEFGVQNSTSEGTQPVFAQNTSGDLLFSGRDSDGYSLVFGFDDDHQLLFSDEFGGSGAILEAAGKPNVLTTFPIVRSFIFALNNNQIVAGFWQGVPRSSGIDAGPDFPFVHQLGSTSYPSFICPAYATDGITNRTIPFAINDNNQVAGLLETASGELGFIATPTGTAPTAQLSATAWSFGNVPAGKISPTATITVTNNGTGPLDIPNLVRSPFSDPDLGNFAITETNCSEPVAPGNSCFISFQFTPKTSDPQSSTLILSDDSPTGPHLVCLTGNGATSCSALKLSNSSWTFGAHPIGQTSGLGKIFIYNNGRHPINTSGFSIGGSGASDFKVIATTCTSAFVQYHTCSVSFDFTPTSVGERTATLNLNDASPFGPTSIPIRGQGK